MKAVKALLVLVLVLGVLVMVPLGFRVFSNAAVADTEGACAAVVAEHQASVAETVALFDQAPQDYPIPVGDVSKLLAEMAEPVVC